VAARAARAEASAHAHEQTSDGDRHHGTRRRRDGGGQGKGEGGAPQHEAEEKRPTPGTGVGRLTHGAPEDAAHAGDVPIRHQQQSARQADEGAAGERRPWGEVRVVDHGADCVGRWEYCNWAERRWPNGTVPGRAGWRTLAPVSAALLVAMLLSVVAGVLLGLLGGGGSIVMVPILHYVLGMEAHGAVGTSLLVIGATSAVALTLHARKQNVRWAIGLWFGVAGMAGSFVAGRLSAHVPDAVLLLLFGTMMLVTATAMLRRRAAPEEAAGPGSGEVIATFSPALAAAAGLGVGALTGLVGVGGGFLIVPALVLIGKVPMRKAVGTSLFVIVLQSSAALAGYLAHASIPLGTAGAVAAAATVGSVAGVALGDRVSPDRLRVFFAIFVFVMGAFVLGDQVLKLLSVEVPRLPE
jgi:uncharacterized membrane protein YfcA